MSLHPDWFLIVLQPGSFRKLTNKVKILHRLAGGTFPKVVLGTEQQHPARARIMVPTHINEVSSGDIFCISTASLTQQTEEVLVVVGFLEGALYVIGLAQQLGAGSRADTIVYRHQMGGEGDRHFFTRRLTEFLFNFGEVTVFGYTIGAHAFVALTENE